MIHYLIGDATHPIDSSGPRVIAHVVNDRGVWARGFVTAVSARWSEPERAYRDWGEGRKLGRNQVITVGPDLYVANMCAQSYSTGLIPESLEWCLRKLNPMLSGATLHMPRIGTGLGRSSWSVVEPIIEKCITACNVYVYTPTYT